MGTPCPLYPSRFTLKCISLHCPSVSDMPPRSSLDQARASVCASILPFYYQHGDWLSSAAAGPRDRPSIIYEHHIRHEPNVRHYKGFSFSRNQNPLPASTFSCWLSVRDCMAIGYLLTTVQQVRRALTFGRWGSKIDVREAALSAQCTFDTRCRRGKYCISKISKSDSNGSHEPKGRKS